MKKWIVLFMLLLAGIAHAADDVDSDNNDALDVANGGTNRTTLSANIQSILGAANYAAIGDLLWPDLTAGDIPNLSASYDPAGTAASAVSALQSDDLVTLSGVAIGSTHLGTFTGDIIADNQTIKTALQALETALGAVDTEDELEALLEVADLADYPLTTAGDLFVGGASGAPGRLAIGTAYQILQTNSGGTAAEWVSTPTFSALNLPSSDADPSTTAGQIRHDSTVANHANGAITWYDGSVVRQIIDMVTATAQACTDDQVVAYDADNDLFYCKDDSTGAGSLGANLSSTTNDITTDNSIFQLVDSNLTENLVFTFTANTLTVTTTSGMSLFDFGALNIGGAAATLTGALGANGVNPDAADGATLGTASLEWSDFYLADGGVIYFGADQDTTVTHVADSGLLTNGYIRSVQSWGADITGNISLNTTALSGVWYQVTAACTITLDAAADAGYGSEVAFRVRDVSETVAIEVDASDKINLYGTALAAGNTIDSPGAAGDFIVLKATTDADGSGTDGWVTLGSSGTWTDGGAT